MAPRPRRFLLHYLLPVAVAALIGGAVGWGYPYASGGRTLGSRRSLGARQPSPPTWEQICHGRIRNGMIAGAIVGLIIVAVARKPE
jgi:hypothetical protein